MTRHEFCQRYEKVLTQLHNRPNFPPQLLADLQACDPCNEKQRARWEENRGKVKGYFQIIEEYIKDPEVTGPLVVAIARLHDLFCPPEELTQREREDIAAQTSIAILQRLSHMNSVDHRRAS